MAVKAHHSEEEYFAREEAAKKQKMALAQAKKLLETQREELKKTHWMHCPKCGMGLETIKYKGVDIDRCFSCNGIWLDDGELEKIVQHDDDPKKGTWVRSVLGIFEAPKAHKKK